MLTILSSGTLVENPPADAGDQEAQVPSLDQEDAPEEETATHSRIPACQTPGTEELSGLQSVGSQK